MPASPRQPTRIDWSAALAFYVGLGPEKRSLAAVHREFGVSEVTVQKHARGGRCRCCPDEGWAALAEREDAKVLEAALAKLAKPRTDMLAQTALARTKVGDELVRRVVEMDDWLARLEDKELRRFFDMLERWTRLDAGEATDHVALSELQGAFQDWVRITAKWVASDLPVEERKAGLQRDLEAMHAGFLSRAAA